MTVANRAGDELHVKHMDALKRVIDMAHIVGSPLVRIMTPKKEQILSVSMAPKSGMSPRAHGMPCCR